MSISSVPGMLKHWLTSLRKLQILRRRVKLARPWLRPGVWLARGSGGRSWTHSSAMRSAGTDPDSTADNVILQGLSGPEGPRLLPPPRLLMGPKVGARGRCAYARPGNGHEVLLDGFSPNAIAKVSVSNFYSREYQELRARLAQHIRLPRYVVSEDRDAIVEERVSGVPLPALNSGATFRLCVDFLEAQYNLVATHGYQPAACQLRESLTGIRSVGLDRQTDAAVSDALATLPARPLKLAPSHGDIGTSNLLLGRNGAPTLIDVDPDMLEWAPATHDSAWLLLQVARPDRGPLVDDIQLSELLLRLLKIVDLAGGTLKKSTIRSQLVGAAVVYSLNTERGGRRHDVSASRRLIGRLRRKTQKRVTRAVNIASKL